VKNPAGEVVIDETSTSEAPASTLNFVICESTASDVAQTEAAVARLSIFPNPVSTTAQLQGLRTNEAWEAKILSVDGNVIHRQNGVGNGTLDMSSLPAGFYAVHVIRYNGLTDVLRLVKK
jgi:hypothetical protein